MGAVLGVLLDAGAWLWAFASVLSGTRTPDFTPIVRVVASGDSVTAVAGPGLLIAPGVLALLGAAVALVVARGRGVPPIPPTDT